VRIHWQSLFLCLAVICCFGNTQAAPPIHAQSANHSPLVLAFYYNWYDENTWTQDKVSDLPLELYVSRDRAVMARQVEQAQSAGIDAFVVSWYGPKTDNNQTELNFSTLLDVAQERGFKAAVDFETASPFINGQAETVAALQYLLDVHASRESYLKADGKPVIFFWAIDRVPLLSGQKSALEAWRAIRQQVDPNRTSLWIAEGVDIQYQEVFDGHHLYNIAWAKSVGRSLSDWGARVRKWSNDNNQPRLWVATVMPGWNDLKTGRSSAYVRDRQNGQFYEESWQAAIASRPDWIIITSFNEWIENSYIEPSQNYGNLYLDLTRKWSERFKSGVIAPEGEPVASDAPSLVLSPTDTPTIEPMPTNTATPEALPTDTPTSEPSPTNTPTVEPLPTDTATPELLPTNTLTPEPSPTNTPTVELIPAHTATLEASSTALIALSTTSAGELPVAATGWPASTAVVLNRRAIADAEQDQATATPSPAYGEVMVSKVPLRDGPGREFPVIGLLHKGFIVQILGLSADGDWFRVVAPTGETGYAETDFIEQRPGFTPASPPPVVVTSPPVPQIGVGGPAGVIRTGTVITGTKLRKGPSSDFGPAAKVEAGDVFELITTNLDGSWYQVRLADGQDGWILAYRTQLQESTTVTSPEPPATVVEAITATLPPTTAISAPAAPQATTAPTAEVRPTSSPTSQTSLSQVMAGDSPHRGQALLGVVLIIAGIGVFLIAVGLGVMHFTSRRAL